MCFKMEVKEVQVPTPGLGLAGGERWLLGTGVLGLSCHKELGSGPEGLWGPDGD